jgi:23S rRNA (uracil1939-C5)-methyltransferase
LKKNQEYIIKISGMTGEGNGVGRTDEGFAVFVPETAPGDLAKVKIAKANKSFAFAILLEILRPSPDRIKPDCPVYKKCGGCCFRHVSYAAELKIKESFVRENLKKIGALDAPVLPVIPSPKENAYRNKAQYPIGLGESGKIITGFFAKRSHRLINCPECALQPGIFAQIAGEFCNFAGQYKISAYDETKHTGLLRHLYIRYGEASGEIAVCIVANGTCLPMRNELVSRLTGRFPDIKTIVLNINREKTNVILGKKYINLLGDGSIKDWLCGLEFNLSPPSFYQVNHGGAETLYKTAEEFAELSGGETLLDLYCGTGTIGLSMARRVKKVVGVEIIPEAIENARRNAWLNGITNAEFILGDAGEAAAGLEKRGLKPDLIILDPPRKGCSPEVLETAARLFPGKIVMISCDSATLARDLKIFGGLGYRTVKIQPVDMFPRTAHIETVALLVNTREAH